MPKPKETFDITVTSITETTARIEAEHMQEALEIAESLIRQIRKGGDMPPTTETKTFFANVDVEHVD